MLAWLRRSEDPSAIQTSHREGRYRFPFDNFAQDLAHLLLSLLLKVWRTLILSGDARAANKLYLCFASLIRGAEVCEGLAVPLNGVRGREKFKCERVYRLTWPAPTRSSVSPSKKSLRRELLLAIKYKSRIGRKEGVGGWLLTLPEEEILGALHRCGTNKPARANHKAVSVCEGNWLKQFSHHAKNRSWRQSMACSISCLIGCPAGDARTNNHSFSLC